MDIDRDNVEDAIAEDADRESAERTHADAQTQDVQPLSTCCNSAIINCADLNGIEAAVARFAETVVIKVLNHRASENVMSKRFQRCSTSDKLMNAAVKRTISSPSFIRPVTGFIKQRVNAIIDN